MISKPQLTEYVVKPENVTIPEPDLNEAIETMYQEHKGAVAKHKKNVRALEALVCVAGILGLGVLVFLLVLLVTVKMPGGIMVVGLIGVGGILGLASAFLEEERAKEPSQLPNYESHPGIKLSEEIEKLQIIRADILCDESPSKVNLRVTYAHPNGEISQRNHVLDIRFNREITEPEADLFNCILYLPYPESFGPELEGVLRVYEITQEEYETQKYIHLDRTIHCVPTHAGWHVGDAVSADPDWCGKFRARGSSGDELYDVWQVCNINGLIKYIVEIRPR